MFKPNEKNDEYLKNKIFVGLVEDNIDEKRKGRVRVRVQGVFNDIELEHIPWASPFRGLDGKDFRVPAIGKIVNVVFPEGNLYDPQYTYSENYNINLQNKLDNLEDDNYTNFVALLLDDRTQIYSDDDNLRLDYYYNQLSIHKKGINVHLKDNDQELRLGHDYAEQSAVLGDHWMIWFDKFMQTLFIPSTLTGNLGAPILRPALDQVISEYKAKRNTFLSKHVKIVDNGSCSDMGKEREDTATSDDFTSINDAKILNSDSVSKPVKDKITENRQKDLKKIDESKPNPEDKVDVVEASANGEKGSDGLTYGDSGVEDVIIEEPKTKIVKENIAVEYRYIVANLFDNMGQVSGYESYVENNIGLPDIRQEYGTSVGSLDKVKKDLKFQMDNFGDFKNNESYPKTGTLVEIEKEVPVENINLSEDDKELIAKNDRIDERKNTPPTPSPRQAPPADPYADFWSGRKGREATSFDVKASPGYGSYTSTGAVALSAAAVNESADRSGQKTRTTKYGKIKNGEIDLKLLSKIEGFTIYRKPKTIYLEENAARAWNKLNKAVIAKFGKGLDISGDSQHYRTFDAQNRLFVKYGAPRAAKPGRSNHGWGLACDLTNFGGKITYTSELYKWLLTEAPKYDIDNPSWARQGSNNPEPWHWEYLGKSIYNV